jgi:hypothetical protein
MLFPRRSLPQELPGPIGRPGLPQGSRALLGGCFANYLFEMWIWGGAPPPAIVFRGKMADETLMVSVISLAKEMPMIRGPERIERAIEALLRKDGHRVHRKRDRAAGLRLLRRGGAR